jgi:hypothetical protein
MREKKHGEKLQSIFVNLKFYFTLLRMIAKGSPIPPQEQTISVLPGSAMCNHHLLYFPYRHPTLAFATTLFSFITENHILGTSGLISDWR